MTDWIVLQALARELLDLRGARVDAVHLEPRRVVLTLRAHGQLVPLALETRQELPQVYRLPRPPERQRAAGPQLQLLRRDLEGARLQGAYAPFGERLLTLCLNGRDRFGDERVVHLVGEFFGSHADVLAASEGQVLFALHGRRRVAGDAFTLPGPKPPPARTLRRAGVVQDLLVRIARGDFAPTVEEQEGRVESAWAFPWAAEGLLVPKESMLDAMSAVAASRLAAMDLRDLRAALRQRLRAQHERALRTLQKKDEELGETLDLDLLLHQGEALKLHLREISPGQGRALLQDPFAQGATVEVPLDPNLSPSDNMARIFRRYQKLRSRAAHLGQEVQDLGERVRVLAEQLQAVERAQDIPALRALREDILPAREAEDEKGAQRGGPLRFTTQGGHEVLVGRSAKENDALTRGARPSDLWFHTKDRQGAHCILRPLPGRPIGAPDRLEAALLAAFYSKQRGGSQVPVDYTFVRHVRRPRGAAPGFVLYDHHETLFVTPDEAAIEAIRRRRGSSRS